MLETVIRYDWANHVITVISKDKDFYRAHMKLLNYLEKNSQQICVLKQTLNDTRDESSYDQFITVRKNKPFTTWLDDARNNIPKCYSPPEFKQAGSLDDDIVADWAGDTASLTDQEIWTYCCSYGRSIRAYKLSEGFPVQEGIPDMNYREFKNYYFLTAYLIREETLIDYDGVIPLKNTRID